MRELISNNTGKKPPEMNSDINLHADGEGGIYLEICWHEMKELGSVAVHLPGARARELIKSIQTKCKEVDE